MKTFLLSPVVAFLIYFLVVLAISGLGKLFSPTGRKSQFKSATYASGEENDPVPAAPGYRQFFVIALFFAILHLGVLMMRWKNMLSICCARPAWAANTRIKKRLIFLRGVTIGCCTCYLFLQRFENSATGCIPAVFFLLKVARIGLKKDPKLWKLQV